MIVVLIIWAAGAIALLGNFLGTYFEIASYLLKEKRTKRDPMDALFAILIAITWPISISVLLSIRGVETYRRRRYLKRRK